MFTFLGGATIFFGPIIGGILMVLASVLLSELTKAWLLYLGLIFLFMVMYAPGGVASLIMMNVRVAAYGLLKRVLGSYVLLALFAVVMFAGAGAMIEMMYHLQLNAGQDTLLRFFGVELDAKSAVSWVGALVVLAVGFGLFEWARRRFMLQWHDIQVTIEKHIQQREVA